VPLALVPGDPGSATPDPSTAPAAPAESPGPGAAPGAILGPGATAGAGGTGGPGTGSSSGADSFLGERGSGPGGPGGAVNGSIRLTGPGGLANGTRGPGSGRGAPGGDADEQSSVDALAAGPFRDDRLTRQILLTGTVSTVVTLTAAFLVFGRRRRDDDGDDGELAVAAATAYGGPLAVAPSVISSLGIDPGTGGTDVDLPRWRRPSLLAARKSDPMRGADAMVATHLAFGAGAAPAGQERRLVRYRIVRLLDRPDELTGNTVGSLDEGDQVAIVGQSGLYRRVETPDGRTGWLHKMTLGDVITSTDAPEPDIDPDVLMAYLAARGRG
jgi:hypothetical protein